MKTDGETPIASLYTWRWSVREASEAALERIRALSGQEPAVVELAGKQRVRVEVFATSEQPLRPLLEQLGGRVVSLSPKIWWRRGLERTRRAILTPRLAVVESDAAAHRAAKRYRDREILVIPAGAAFGTGAHATTRLRLEAVDLASPVERMTDAGTGSGVLAIAAARLGCRKVSAFDIDPAAVRTAKANAIANGVKIQVQRGGLDRPGPVAELVAANILSGPLIEHAAMVASRVAPGGTLILSGFRPDEVAAVRRAYPSFRKVRLAEAERWCCLVLRKSRDIRV